MKFFAVFALVAAGLAAAGEEPTDSTTTTVTSTLTKTMTITQCNPTYSDCPYASSTVAPEPEEPTSISSSEEPAYPAHNTTIIANSSSGLSTKTSEPTVVTATSTSVVDSEPTDTPDTVSNSGAGSLYVNLGLLMSVFAAGAALL